jgi:hypothetical protein
LFEAAVLLGSLLVPLFVLWLVHRLTKQRFLTKSLACTFLVALFWLSVVANMIWETWIRGHVYYEWDSIISPDYIITTYDSPLIEGTTLFDLGRGPANPHSPLEGSWLAAGWSQFSLYLLWRGITTALYFLTFSAMYLVGQAKAPERAIFRRFLIQACIALIGLSAVCGFFDEIGQFIISLGSMVFVAPIFWVLKLLGVPV